MNAINYKDLLGQKSLSKSDKQHIQEKYLSTFGREMRLKDEKCRDCFNDALLELINCENKVKTVIFNGKTFKITKK